MMSERVMETLGENKVKEYLRLSAFTEKVPKELEDLGAVSFTTTEIETDKEANQATALIEYKFKDGSFIHTRIWVLVNNR